MNIFLSVAKMTEYHLKLKHVGKSIGDDISLKISNVKFTSAFVI